ncbi:MAG: holo-ACP synthase [Alphaproteobacteria bacterium]|nr:holo-ACP synthase [Alphaproteobacteria bacterium]
MILGIGNDIVDIRRIEKAFERHGERFIERCFTPHEQKKAKRRESAGTQHDVYAKRFAAKEACAKALGTGFAKNIVLKDIGVVENEEGRPFLELSGGALEQLVAITPKGKKAVLHLSLSDEPPMAQAFVVIEAL